MCWDDTGTCGVKRPVRCSPAKQKKGIKMDKITADMTIGEILELHPKMANALKSAGMHCVGCGASLNETLEQAAEVHGMDLFLLEVKLNAFLNEALQGRI